MKNLSPPLPPISMMKKRGILVCAQTRHWYGGRGFYFPFYSVQECSLIFNFLCLLTLIIHDLWIITVRRQITFWPIYTQCLLLLFFSLVLICWRFHLFSKSLVLSVLSCSKVWVIHREQALVSACHCGAEAVVYGLQSKLSFKVRQVSDIIMTFM